MTYSTNDTIISLEEKFNDTKFNYRSVVFGGTIPVFFIYPKNEKILKEKWEEIANLIAVDFQARQTDEYQVWNIYLFYVMNNQVNKDLKYKIENDIFSSRKIIVDYTANEDSMIEEHIINRISVNFGKDEKLNNDFYPNETIESLLVDKTLKKINITKAANTTYKELIKALKNNRNEI